jgi:excisionase family DNA binding protein
MKFDIGSKSLNQKQLYSITETAQQIGMGITKTRELISKGEIISVRIGTAVRVPASAVAEFVRQLEAQQQ